MKHVSLCLLYLYNMSMTTNDNSKATPGQVRRAAGSQSLDKLKATLATGWTVKELDSMTADGGKSALHMAAWKGCLQNVQYLLQLGCDINGMATGEYSYGKTALFFACTMSRNEHVQYLVQQGANVKIVNNKGQSVLSIAASHLQTDVIQLIQQAEQAQAAIEWRNYRSTHSDGHVYGDLDPRFLERPVRTTDVVTPLVINPTTKQSRRGNFLRHNPQVARRRRKERDKPKRVTKKQPFGLSEQTQAQLDAIWERMEQSLRNHDGTARTLSTDLLALLRLSDQQRHAWIPAVRERLQAACGGDFTRVRALLQSLEIDDNDTRLCQLVDKLCEVKSEARNGGKLMPKLAQQILERSVPFNRQLLRQARQTVEGLSISTLEQMSKLQLSLPRPAIWVDSTSELAKLANIVERSSVLGMDTEWTTIGNENIVSTVQFAKWTRDDGFHAWVVDLLPPDESYQKACKNLVQGLFDKKILLGFAMGHDVPKLERWLGTKLPHEKLLDVQRLWSGKALPGLARCAQDFSALPLSKQEQCSDWSRRPISLSQLEYAGLDAAILLTIVAEKSNKLV